MPFRLCVIIPRYMNLWSKLIKLLSSLLLISFCNAQCFHKILFVLRGKANKWKWMREKVAANLWIGKQILTPISRIVWLLTCALRSVFFCEVKVFRGVGNRCWHDNARRVCSEEISGNITEYNSAPLLKQIMRAFFPNSNTRSEEREIYTWSRASIQFSFPYLNRLALEGWKTWDHSF